MTPAEVEPAAKRLLMLAAQDPPAVAELRSALADFDTVPAVARLAALLATAIAEKLPWTPLAFPLDAAPELVAFLMVRRVHMGGHDLDALLAGLEPDELAAVTTALLAMWREACEHAAAITLDRITIPTHLGQELS